MTLARGPLLGGMVLACERFNERHPVGSSINVHVGGLIQPTIRVRVVTPGAYVLGGHTAVVQVSDGLGCIALTHVEKDAPA